MRSSSSCWPPARDPRSVWNVVSFYSLSFGGLFAIGAVLLPLVANIPLERVRRIWAIAKLSFKEALSRRILLNLERTTFIDTSGIAWLLSCHKRCLQAGGRFVLHSAPPLIDQTLRVLRMEDIIGVIRTLVDLRDGKGEIEYIDHLVNRRVSSVG